MVQQPFGSGGGPQAAGTTLAMPAIVAGQTLNSNTTNNTNSQNHQQQSAYSPQDNYYQQQLLKNAVQQQYGQQAAIQHPVRLNGLSTTLNSSQTLQDSPNSSIQQQAQPSIENSLYSRAPIYAPKPATYYSPQQQQQQVAATAASVYGPARIPIQPAQQAFYSSNNSQQHSPASLQRTALSGLSVRHLPMVLSQPNNLSPQQPQQQQIIQSQQALDQQQRQQQMQQLIMSYQQQQQFGLIQTNGDILGQPTYAQNVGLIQEPQQDQQPLVQQQTKAQQQPHLDIRWAQIQEEQRQLQQQQQQQQQFQQQRHLYTHQQPTLHSERLVGAITGRPATRYSDRDSVSTLSRFNQFDERRSITMRSQYTSANNSARFDRNFGFIKPTVAALKRILGITIDYNCNEKHNLNRNIRISATQQDPTNNKNNTNPLDNNNQAAKNTTVIDSAEDHYFKKKVFRYQLTIMRLLSLLSAAFVLLSPVAMLLIPKMESVFNSGARDYSSDSTSSSSSNDQNSPTPSITHAVGLSGKQAFANQRQPPYYMQQPQWRIGECTSDCDGLLIGFVTRLIMLCIAYWAIFFRTQTASLPRIDFQRCLITSMAFLVTLAYWLFFIFRLFDKRFNDFELQYISVVQFSLSMLESLILLHYLAVILLELRSRKKVYCIKVVRSPDGESQYFSCGAVSIQKCAQIVLEKYHRQFKQYNQYKQHLLDLEQRHAQSMTSNSNSGTRDDISGNERTSRPTSPANSQSGNHRTNRRSTSRASRHHHNRNRSPSSSPVRERSRSQKKSYDGVKGNTENHHDGTKLYQVDLVAPSKDKEVNQKDPHQTTSQAEKISSTNKTTTNEENQDKQAKENDNNSGDQSSDGTSRMKESSLETIRAANSTSDLITQQKSINTEIDDIKQANSKRLSNEGNSASKSGGNNHQSSRDRDRDRDEIESVRSVRSRRSTSRSHKYRDRDRERDRERERDRDHHHHKERSSSRAHDHSYDHRHSSTTIPIFQSDPIEDHERKLRRRKFRLLVAVQDAFDHIKRSYEAEENQANASQQQQNQKQLLGPNQTARSLYPGIARSLQKYLRLTKQTGRHNLQSIYEHLSKCLLYKLSPRVFLEKFFNLDPVWQQNETNLFANCTLQDSMLMCHRQKADYFELNSWSLVCDTLSSRQIDSGIFFVLKQGQVSLLVTIARLPHLNLTEEVIDQSSCKFTVGSNIIDNLGHLVYFVKKKL